MKLLMTMNVPFTRSHGGANRSNRALLEGLAARGHTTAVVTPALASPSSITYETWRAELEAQGVTLYQGEHGVSFRQNQVDITAVPEPRHMRRAFLDVARRFAPDWLLVASEDPSQSLLAAALEACPDRVVYLALTPQLFPFGPESLYPGPERTEMVRRCALVCCLSRITADYIQTHADVTAHVYQPPHFGTGPFPQFHNFHDGAVLLMNACAVKGLPIFLNLAQALPHIAFAALPGYATTTEDRRMLQAYPNISLWQNAADLDRILSRTRALLMPTLWMESFGLAVVDAMLRGIPVLASDHGALPEAKLGTEFLLPVRPITQYRDELGDNFLPLPVVPPQDVGPWQDALSKLLGDESVYRRHAMAARHAALQFVDGLSVEPFEHLLLTSPTVPRPTTAAPLAPSTGDELTPEQKALLILRLRDRAGQRQTDSKPTATIQTAPRDTPLPLSFAQERLFFLERLYPGTAVYNCPSAIQLRGQLDENALRRAFETLVHRHEALRTTFDVQDGQPVQCIAPELPLDLPAIDLTAVAETDRDTQLHHVMQREACQPFDLSTAPLIRVCLVRLGADNHVLMLNLHHIVTDGWSTDILMQEFASLYTAYTEGAPDALPQPSLQYADYAVWQRHHLQGVALQESVDYWKSALKDAPAALELPTDRPRPAVQKHLGTTVRFRTSAALTTQLKQLARRQNATLFMTLLAAFNALLHRISNQHDIVVGSPVANRDRIETEKILGFFVNTVALRTQLSGHPTFTELLDRVKASTLAAFAHQELPFEKLVAELAPERSQSYSPLFQVLFALHNTPDTSFQLPGLHLTPLHMHSGTSKFDLNMELTETTDGLEGSLEYDRELFDAETISHLLQCWQVLLAGIVAHPDKRLGAYALLTPEQMQAVIEAPNPAYRAVDAQTSVIGLFRDQAARTPEAPAVHDNGRIMTYAELDGRSNQLAHLLIEAGVGTDCAVGLCLERGLEMVVAVLGTLKAGGVYVPLDPSYPTDRLNFMMRQAAMPLVLSQQHLAERFHGLGVRILTLDDVPPAYHAALADDPGMPLRPDSLAYIMYTSGSTGQPKGVQLPHQALVALILWHLEKFPGPRRTLQFAPLNFDASFHEIFATLATGGCLYIFTDDRRDLLALPQFLRRHHIEKTILPVVILHHLAEHCVVEGVEGLDVNDFICTGEQLKVTPAMAELLQRMPEASLHNDYGPTETHVATSVRVSERADLWAPFPPIGHPIRNARAYVLDRYLDPMPPGLPGELYLAGDCLARGYHQAPHLTAERFLPDPFSPVAGGRMYRTGDLARIGRDGYFEYLGRIDHQVKIRGLRVEPGEIEAALRTFPGLEDCLVICREDQADDKRLVAYVIMADQEMPLASNLSQHLESLLPEYMIPAAFVPLERFPLTPNGKVDRDALPVPQTERSSLDDAWMAPRTDIEQQIAAIWAEVLGPEAIGIQDDFFALGGHSILTIQIASRLYTTFGVELSAQSFFNQPTIEQQALEVTRLLAAQQGEGDLEALLDQLDELDEAEVSRLLEEGDPPVQT